MTEISAAPAGVDLQAYNAQTRRAESGNNPNIGYHDRRLSTAGGPYGITDPTWMGLANKYPQLGLSMANRFDLAANERAKDALTREQAQGLQARGIQPTSYALGMTAFLGPAAGMAILQAAPGANALGVITAAIGADKAAQFARSNPSILHPGATAGDVQARGRRDYGGAGGGEASTPTSPNPPAQITTPPPTPAYIPPPAEPTPQAQIDPMAYLAMIAPTHTPVKVNYDPFAVMPKL